MASLYIKNADTAELAEEVAALLGTTKTAAVHEALLARKQTLERERRGSIHERMKAWRAAHPLGEPTGLKADKALSTSSPNDQEDD
ncbi:type II toxin-antitoxin system VapB family antitoxin [Sphingomonas sp. MMS24-JH45]